MHGRQEFSDRAAGVEKKDSLQSALDDWWTNIQSAIDRNLLIQGIFTGAPVRLGLRGCKLVFSQAGVMRLKRVSKKDEVIS